MIVFRSLWLLVGWALILLVTIVSLTPKPLEISLQFGDKIGHTLAYFALMGWFSQVEPRHFRLALAFLAMGASLEIIQGLTGYRDASLLDMLANSLGVGLGWIVRGAFPGLRASLGAGRP